MIFFFFFFFFLVVVVVHWQKSRVVSSNVFYYNVVQWRRWLVAWLSENSCSVRYYEMGQAVSAPDRIVSQRLGKSELVALYLLFFPFIS